MSHLEDRRGADGSGQLAEHSTLGRCAAIKVLHNEFSGRRESVARLLSEARAATIIAGPGIVQIFDLGHAADGSAYMVMELLGESLGECVTRVGDRIDLPQALRIVRQVASAVGAARERRIVHAISTENMFVVCDPEVRMERGGFDA